LSGFPVDVAILFGPGLIAWMVKSFYFNIDYARITNPLYRDFRFDLII